LEVATRTSWRRSPRGTAPPASATTKAATSRRPSGVDGLLEVAAFVVAEAGGAVPLGDLLQDVRVAAGWAALRDRAVPGDGVALGVVAAAEEDAAAAGAALDDAAAALVARAVETDLLQLDVPALGVVGAGGELAEAAILDGQGLAALRALLVEDPVGLLGDGDLAFLV